MSIVREVIFEDLAYKVFVKRDLENDKTPPKIFAKKADTYWDVMKDIQDPTFNEYRSYVVNSRHLRIFNNPYYYNDLDKRIDLASIMFPHLSQHHHQAEKIYALERQNCYATQFLLNNIFNYIFMLKNDEDFLKLYKLTLSYWRGSTRRVSVSNLSVDNNYYLQKLDKEFYFIDTENLFVGGMQLKDINDFTTGRYKIIDKSSNEEFVKEYLSIVKKIEYLDNAEKTLIKNFITQTTQVNEEEVTING